MRLEHVGHPMVDFFHLKKMDSCNRDPGRLICDPLLQCKWKGEGGASWPYILIKRMLELHSSNTWRIRLFPLVCIGLGLVHDLNVLFFLPTLALINKEKRVRMTSDR